MASGFDHLLEFLLDEIALSGTQGISIPEFKLLVGKYYASGKGGTQPISQTSLNASHDHRLLQRIWSWLTAIPDLLVGPAGEGQALPLSEVEAREHEVASSKESGQPLRALRLFTTEDRMWLAVAGHQKDIKLIPPYQFTILCIIAAAGKDGITQPDVVRKSGQDKRSVPKRTDYLALRGYIEKRPIYIKAARTSLLVHKKFLKSSGNADRIKIPDSLPTEIFRSEQLDFNKFVLYLSDRLKDSNIMTEGDLMSELGLLISMKWHREIVRKAIDKLVIAGIIECFNSPSQIMTVNGSFRRLHCIKLLRTPTSSDTKAASAVSRSDIVAYRLRRQQEEAASRRREGEEDGGIENPTEAEFEEQNRFQMDNMQGIDDRDEERLTITTGRITSTIPSADSVPLCSGLDIDSSLHYNVVYQLIKDGGQKGVASSQIRDASYGPFYTRPVDVILRGLCDVWDTSQPPHLRHLTIIRDAETTSRSSQYRYRTFENFQKAVDLGETAWEAVSGPDSTKRLKQPKMDKWGFPILPLNQFLHKTKPASLKECALACRDLPITLTSQDPTLLGNGSEIKLEWNRSRIRGGKAISNGKRPLKSVTIDGEGAIQVVQRKSTIPGHGPGMIAGLTQQEYHRRYRFAQKIKEDQKARRPQLRRHAKWLATMELADQFNERFQNGEWKELVDDISPAVTDAQMASTGILQDSPSLKRKRKSESMISLSIVTRKRAKVSKGLSRIQSSSSNAVSEDSTAIPTDTFNQLNIESPDLSSSASCITPIARPRPTIGLKRPLVPTEAQISALVQGLESCSAQGVHINPPGSSYYLPNFSTPKGRKALVIKFKFEWLRNLDWFVEELYNASPGEAKEHTVINEIQRATGFARPRKGDNNAHPIAHVDLQNPRPLLEGNGVEPFRKNRDSLDSTPWDKLNTPFIGRYIKRKLSVGVYRVKKLGRPRKDALKKDTLIMKFVLPSSSMQVDEDTEMVDVVEQTDCVSIDHNDSRRSSVETPEQIHVDNGITSRTTVLSHINPIPNRNTDGVRTSQTEASSIQQNTPQLHNLNTSTDLDGNSFLNQADNEVNGQIGNTDQVPSRLLPTNDFDVPTDKNQATNTALQRLSMTPVRESKRVSAEIPWSHGLGRKPSTGLRQGAIIGTGSSRFKRGVIILDIVKKCGGAFPGDGEIILPFNSLEKKTSTTLADRQTIMKAIKNLVDQGKLKRVAYIFTSTGGSALTKHVLLLPELSFEDPKVQDLIEKCKESYPRRYLPPEVDDRPPPDNKKSTPGTSRYFRPDESIVLVPDIYRNAASDPNVQPWALDFFERQKRLAEARQSLFEKGRQVGEASVSQIEQKPAQVVLTKTFDQRKDITNPLQLNIGPSVFDDTYQERNPKKLKISSTNYVWNGVAYSRVETPNSIEHSVTDLPKWPTWKMGLFLKQQARHQLRIMTPKQTFHPLTGTFSTEFKVHSGRTKKPAIENPELAEVEVIESESEIDIETLNREVRQWTRSGHNIQILGEGPDSGFIIYSLAHPHISVPIAPIEAIHSPAQTAAIKRPSVKRLVKPPTSLELSRFPDRMPLGPPGIPLAAAIRHRRPQVPITEPSQEDLNVVQQNRAKENWVKLNPICIITPKAAKKLLYAVIVARTLAGGVSQTVPWPLVDSIFLKEGYPNYSQQNFRRRWEWMTKYHRDAVERLQIAFEEAFLEAYENGELPALEVNEIYDYDWPRVVEWALKTVDVISDQTVLPLTKVAFTNSFQLNLFPRTSTRTFESAYRHNYTTYKRSLVINMTEISTPLNEKFDSSAHLEDLQLARSWAQAAVSNAQTVNGDPIANSKLRNLDDGLLRRAIDGLLEDRVIVPASRGSKAAPVSTRFQPQDKMSVFLRSRPFKTQMFADALAFKRNLDSVFTRPKASLALPQDASDGQIMALNELVAVGRVKVVPQLPPIDSTIGASAPRISVWGMNEGSYEAKKIDRKVYMWDLQLEPSETYVLGLPLQNLINRTTIPLHHPDDAPGRERIPFWVNIHGTFLADRWRRCLMAIVSMCSLEAGVTVSVLQDIMKNVLVTWEIELIVKWLRDIDALEVAPDTGFTGPLIVKEWWWTIIPPE